MNEENSLIDPNAPPTFHRVFHRISGELFGGKFDDCNVYAWVLECYINRVSKVEVDAQVVNGRRVKYICVYVEYWSSPFVYAYHKNRPMYDCIERMCEELNKEIAIHKMLFDV